MKLSILLIGSFALLLSLNGPVCAAGTPPPNIVLIMADDMGYSDIGCYGSEIQTPNIDRMAANGLRFTQFYNTGRCCPTRASLLTGLYPHQAGVGHMVNDRNLPGYRGRLNENCVTLAEVLKPAGYRTGVSGKWHVTPFDYETEKASHPASWPLQRGFDFFRGSLAGGGNFFRPKGWMHGNDFVKTGEGFYYTDAVSENAAEFIRTTDAAQPLFLYMAYTAPHWPLHAHEEDIARYEGKYDQGWDKLREQRLARMRELGLIKEEWKLSGRDKKVPAWEQAKNKKWEARRMAVYAAQIDRMDQGIGQVIKALEQSDRIDNTLILFLADNGGCAEVIGGSKRHAHADTDTSRWGTRPDVMPGGPDTYASYGVGWANASNTPFRLYKHYVHEGGISSPLVAHWPKGIDAAQYGKLNHSPAHLVDIMATCIDLAKASYPDERNGLAMPPAQGVSLRPAFKGGQLQRSQPLFFEHEGNRALRDGPWKIVAKGARGAWELYNLDTDRTELNNLAAKQPERLQQMVARWDKKAESTHAKPAPWSAKKKK